MTTKCQPKPHDRPALQWGRGERATDDRIETPTSSRTLGRFNGAVANVPRMTTKYFRSLGLVGIASMGPWRTCPGWPLVSAYGAGMSYKRQWGRGERGPDDVGR